MNTQNLIGKFVVIYNSMPGFNFIGEISKNNYAVVFEGTFSDCLSFACQHNWYLNDNVAFCYYIASKATHKMFMRIDAELID